MKPGTRVLIVEDDHSIARVVQLQLEHRGFSVRCCHDGISGLEEVPKFRPEVIVLDIMLPGLDGVGVLKELRSTGIRVPIIMLTARDTPMDKIHSLDHGADDYLSKPYDMGELMARIRALLRRVEGEEILRVADLEIDTAAHIVRRGEEDRVDSPRVRTLGVHGAKCPPGAFAGYTPLTGLGTRLRRDERGGRVHWLPPQEDRRPRGEAADPHRQGGRLCSEE